MESVRVAKIYPKEHFEGLKYHFRTAHGSNRFRNRMVKVKKEQLLTRKNPRTSVLEHHLPKFPARQDFLVALSKLQTKQFQENYVHSR